jgi:hypothetical protein
LLAIFAAAALAWQPVSIKSFSVIAVAVDKKEVLPQMRLSQGDLFYCRCFTDVKVQKTMQMRIDESG